jgi:hypothetical protein
MTQSKTLVLVEFAWPSMMARVAQDDRITKGWPLTDLNEAAYLAIVYVAFVLLSLIYLKVVRSDWKPARGPMKFYLEADVNNLSKSTTISVPQGTIKVGDNATFGKGDSVKVTGIKESKGSTKISFEKSPKKSYTEGIVFTVAGGRAPAKPVAQKFADEPIYMIFSPIYNAAQVALCGWMMYAAVTECVFNSHLYSASFVLAVVRKFWYFLLLHPPLALACPCCLTHVFSPLFHVTRRASLCLPSLHSGCLSVARFVSC